jgi:RHS repeat-associated protein
VQQLHSVWTRLQVGGPAGKTAEYRGGTVYFYAANHLGSVAAVMDRNGTVVEQLRFYPFGERRLGSGGERQQFTGQERDGESGNDYFGARYYWSGAGRWLGADPVLGEMTNPQRLNRYAYVLNDPVNYIDPDGEDPIVVTTVVCTIFGGQKTCYTTTKVDPGYDPFENHQLNHLTYFPAPKPQLPQIMAGGGSTSIRESNTPKPSEEPRPAPVVDFKCISALLSLADVLTNIAPIGFPISAPIDVMAYYGTEANWHFNGGRTPQKEALNLSNLAAGLFTGFASEAMKTGAIVAGLVAGPAGGGSLIAAFMTSTTGGIVEYAILEKLARLDGYDSFLVQLQEVCGIGSNQNRGRR